MANYNNYHIIELLRFDLNDESEELLITRGGTTSACL